MKFYDQNVSETNKIVLLKSTNGEDPTVEYHQIHWNVDYDTLSDINGPVDVYNVFVPLLLYTGYPWNFPKHFVPGEPGVSFGKQFSTHPRQALHFYLDKYHSRHHQVCYWLKKHKKFRISSAR
ncbi:MAG: hypothetical protein CMM25_04730 [Rhodospirillaceae bacterium]|nr:hypothetical protein [Rhodospirillaceae bacterium]